MAVNGAEQSADMKKLDEDEEAQLRSLLQPFVALGKTLPLGSRRHLQSAVRSLVEWALESRNGDMDKKSFDLRFTIPSHRPGLSFLDLSRGDTRGDIRSSVHSPLEIENKAVVYDFRNAEILERATEVVREDVPTIIHKQRESRICLPALLPATTTVCLPGLPSVATTALSLPALPPCSSVVSIDRTSTAVATVEPPSTSVVRLWTESERIRVLEEENIALREKVFKLIKTLSIESEKSRRRINNLQFGMGLRDKDPVDDVAEHVGVLCEYRSIPVNYKS